MIDDASRGRLMARLGVPLSFAWIVVGYDRFVSPLNRTVVDVSFVVLTVCAAAQLILWITFRRFR